MSWPDITRAKQTTSDFGYLVEHLRQYHGIGRVVASHRLHLIKLDTGRRGDDNVVFDLTGNVYDPTSSEYLGSLTYGGKEEVGNDE